MIKIAVDAMGSDRSPKVEVDGALDAAAQYGIPIVLVGHKDKICPLLEDRDMSGLSVEVEHASEAVTMDDSPTTAFRRKKDSSINVAAQLMRDGKVSGVVSAGNTGAVMATAKFVVGALPVVDRPALSTVTDTEREARYSARCWSQCGLQAPSPEQFAIMGDIYSRTIFGIRRPRVGLLSIGEEDTKGK
jgi:glycerol-3-phosphate acyltransferase PlsX